jgi:hypothetical protein
MADKELVLEMKPESGERIYRYEKDDERKRREKSQAHASEILEKSQRQREERLEKIRSEARKNPAVAAMAEEMGIEL